MKEQPVLIPQPIKKYGEARQWTLAKDFTLYIPWLKREIVIPATFCCDLGSVPRIAHPIISPTDILIPGLIHDFGYRFDYLLVLDKYGYSFNAKEGLTGRCGKYYPIKIERGKRFHDILFYRILNMFVRNYVLNKICYKAVKYGGHSAWQDRRNELHETR